jgi:hypothetical protein
VTAPTTAAAGDTPGRPARPGGDAYWALVDRIVAQAPPLTDEQRAVIRTAFHTSRRTPTGVAA